MCLFYSFTVSAVEDPEDHFQRALGKMYATLPALVQPPADSHASVSAAGTGPVSMVTTLPSSPAVTDRMSSPVVTNGMPSSAVTNGMSFSAVMSQAALVSSSNKGIVYNGG